MAVNVVFHGYDHSLIEDAIHGHPQLFRGGLVIDPLVSPEAAASNVARMYSRDFTFVRFKGNLWPGPGRLGIKDTVGQAVVRVAGDREMSVAVLSEFVDEPGQAEEIESLCRDFPRTPVLVDHFGGNGGPTSFSGDGWQRLLALSRFDNAHVKVTGWHPHGIAASGDATLQLISSLPPVRITHGSAYKVLRLVSLLSWAIDRRDQYMTCNPFPAPPS